MIKKWFQLLCVLLMVLLMAANASAHCEIPCGIYDDQMRIDMIAEHITTMEKSMKQIVELGGKKPTNHNQLSRWVTNKEHHADELQHIVTQYFMTQRIKLDTDKYSEKLASLHKLLVYAMKCKQTTDLSHIATLRAVLKEFQERMKLHGNWHLLNGTETEARLLAAAIGFQFRKTPDGHFTHSTTVMLLNEKGEPVHRKDRLNSSLEEITEAARRLTD